MFRVCLVDCSVGGKKPQHGMPGRGKGNLSWETQNLVCLGVLKPRVQLGESCTFSSMVSIIFTVDKRFREVGGLHVEIFGNQ